MKTKNVIYWILGISLCALGLALCTKANLGISMIGALPYVVHVFMIQYFPWFSQGVSEYVVEGILFIVTLIIIRRFKVRYLLTIVTAVFSGLCIDGILFLFGGNGPFESLTVRIIAFIGGILITSFAIACIFRTTLPPAVYEFSVAEIADRYNIKKSTMKYVFDATILGLDIVLALVLNHNLQGIGLGTILITIINAPLIKMFSKIIDFFEQKYVNKMDNLEEKSDLK